MRKWALLSGDYVIIKTWSWDNGRSTNVLSFCRNFLRQFLLGKVLLYCFPQREESPGPSSHFLFFFSEKRETFQLKPKVNAAFVWLAYQPQSDALVKQQKALSKRLFCGIVTSWQLDRRFNPWFVSEVKTPGDAFHLFSLARNLFPLRQQLSTWEIPRLIWVYWTGVIWIKCSWIELSNIIFLDVQYGIADGFGVRDRGNTERAEEGGDNGGVR